MLITLDATELSLGLDTDRDAVRRPIVLRCPIAARSELRGHNPFR